MAADGDRLVIHVDPQAVARDGVAYWKRYAWFFRMRAGKVVAAPVFFGAIAFNELGTHVAAVNWPSMSRSCAGIDLMSALRRQTGMGRFWDQ